MLNSKDFKTNELVVDYLFEYKEAVKNYKNFDEIAKIVVEQTKTNPRFVLSCVHYNTKTKKFFIDSTKFDQYSITVYNSFSSIFENGFQATNKTLYPLSVSVIVFPLILKETSIFRGINSTFSMVGLSLVLYFSTSTD